MFSVSSFTCAAIRAISATPSGVNSSSTPSVLISSVYCRISEFSGSVRIRTKSASPSAPSSTRSGNRPCSSGIRSDGFVVLNAPAAMKRIWSVCTGPYFVITVDPSTIGSSPRCTPSRLTSGPPTAPCRPAILSISSMKMIPDCSARLNASPVACSISIIRSASWSSRIRRASATVTFRRCRCFGNIPPSMS